MIRQAFGVPGFTRLFGGLVASMAGDSLMLIVLSMWVKTLTGSNGAAGLTFLWMTAPALAAPLFGYVVDRVPRRAFLVVANLATAVALLPLLAVHDAGDVWIVYLVAFCYGISFVVVPAALNGLLKDLVPEELLVDVNASLSVTKEGLRLGAPLLGATLFALFGGSVVALVDLVTFVLAALAVLSLRVRETPPEATAPHWRAELTAGAAFVLRTPVLLHCTVAIGICLLVLGFIESAIFAVADAFHQPVTFVGPLLSVQGVGAITGGLLSARMVRRLGEPLTLVVGLLLGGTGVGAVAVAQELWQVYAATAVLGAGIPVVVVAYNTLLQRSTPGALMGRVTSFTDVLTTTPQALSIAAGAALVTLVDYRVVYALMFAGTMLAAAYPVVALRERLRPRPGPTPDLPRAGWVGVSPALPAAAPRSPAP